jgi:hypothetical protein
MGKAGRRAKDGGRAIMAGVEAMGKGSKANEWMEKQRVRKGMKRGTHAWAPPSGAPQSAQSGTPAARRGRNIFWSGFMRPTLTRTSAVVPSSMSPMASRSTVTVRSAPILGGSSETEMDLIWTASEGSPARQPPTPTHNWPTPSYSLPPPSRPKDDLSMSK